MLLNLFQDQFWTYTGVRKKIRDANQKNYDFYAWKVRIVVSEIL